MALLFVGVALGFVAVLVWRQWTSLGEMSADLQVTGWSLQPVWLAAALALAVGNLFLMAGVWVGLFRAAGGSIGTRDGTRAWMVTNLGRYIPGKVWQLTGLAVYMRGRGESAGAALASAVRFQVLLLVTGTAAALATLGTELTGAGLTWAAVSAVVLLVPLVHPRVARWLMRRMARLTGELAEEPVPARNGRLLGGAGALFAAWAVYGVGLTWLMRGLGVRTEGAGTAVVTGTFAAAYVIGYLALVAPGGLVVREGALAGLLSSLTPMPLAVSAAIAVVARLWVTASELLALAIAVWLVARGEKPATARAPVDPADQETSRR